MRDVLAVIGAVVVACAAGIVALFGTYELRDRWARRRVARTQGPPVIGYLERELNPHPDKHPTLHVDARSADEAWAAIDRRAS